MTRVVVAAKEPGRLTPIPGLHPNVDRAVRESGNGRLIYCERCLDKMHCAPWVDAATFARRLQVFTACHAEECRKCEDWMASRT